MENKTTKIIMLFSCAHFGHLITHIEHMPLTENKVPTMHKNTKHMKSTYAKSTGIYTVGTTYIHMIDKKRLEPRKLNADQPHRELLVQTWYPAKITSDETEHAPYVPDKLTAFIKSRSNKQDNWFDGSGYIGTNILSHSYQNTPISDCQNQFPIVIFSPGYGVPCHSYTSILEDIASHGFIVFGINHTYTSDPIMFPDGRIIELAPYDPTIDEVALRAGDITFILNKLESMHKKNKESLFYNRCDLSSIGVIGHSIGASTALEVGAQDKRCKALVALDGLDKNAFLQQQYQVKHFDIPLMLMYNAQQGIGSKNDAYAPELNLNDIYQTMKNKAKKQCEVTTNHAYEIQCKAHHMSFSDYFMLTNTSIDQDSELDILKTIKSMINAFLVNHLSHNKNEQKTTKLLNNHKNKAFFIQYWRQGKKNER